MNIIKFFSSTGSVPYKATTGSAGYDLCSSEDITLAPNERIKIPTGLYCEIPAGYEIQIRNRSGMSFKTGLLIIHGTIDSDYRGEIFVIAVNLNKNILNFEKGTRIAQMIIAKYESLDFVPVSSPELLEKTDRGINGFGHTGLN